MAETSTPDEFLHPLKVSNLSDIKNTEFSLTPNEGESRYIAEILNLSSVKKMRFEGHVAPDGSDWVLSAQLGASVVQPCVVTLEPVRTRVDIPVERRFTNKMPEIEESESEIPDDDRLEILGEFIDPAHVAMEALALALPEYPRVDGAKLENADFTAPDVQPLTDSDLKPFAGLAALKDKLAKDE